MNYSISAESKVRDKGSIDIKKTKFHFGTAAGHADTHASPAELFLAAIAACLLKNVERFSKLMRFEYSHAKVTVVAERLVKPPRMDNVHYELAIYSKDTKLNKDLLKKNIERFGTIYNTVQRSSNIDGTISLYSNFSIPN